MDLNLSVFQEPRGVMRIIQFVFSICAFATISGYSGDVKFGEKEICTLEYAFNVICMKSNISCQLALPCNTTVTMNGNYSSDAKFFVATGVLAMLYCIAITIIYIKFDEMYKANTMIPLADFALSVIFAILWLSSSAAWANGLNGLKSINENAEFTNGCKCDIETPDFSTLTISVILGFLNFFLWGADLWFLYKETVWFQGAQPGLQAGN